MKFKVRDNPPGDFKRMFRHISKGSWTFSDRDHGWQVSDCTAESLKVILLCSIKHIIFYLIRFAIKIMPENGFIVLQCCLYFAMMPPEMVGEKIETEQFYDAVNVILSLQVRIDCHRLRFTHIVWTHTL